MREIKQMLENLEGQNITMDLIGNDEVTFLIKKLHSYIDKSNYIIFEDELDENEFRFRFPVGTVMCIEEEYGEYLVCRNTGTDYKISVNN